MIEDLYAMVDEHDKRMTSAVEGVEARLNEHDDCVAATIRRFEILLIGMEAVLATLAVAAT